MAVRWRERRVWQARREEDTVWAGVPCGPWGPLPGGTLAAQQLPGQATGLASSRCIQSAPLDFTDPPHRLGHLVPHKRHWFHRY